MTLTHFLVPVWLYFFLLLQQLCVRDSVTTLALGSFAQHHHQSPTFRLFMFKRSQHCPAQHNRCGDSLHHHYPHCVVGNWENILLYLLHWTTVDDNNTFTCSSVGLLSWGKSIVDVRDARWGCVVPTKFVKIFCNLIIVGYNMSKVWGLSLFVHLILRNFITFQAAARTRTTEMSGMKHNINQLETCKAHLLTCVIFQTSPVDNLILDNAYPPFWFEYQTQQNHLGSTLIRLWNFCFTCFNRYPLK